MPRLALDREIRQIQDEILLLGSLVEQAILNAVEALKTRDVQAAEAVIRDDRYINDKRFAIENRILILFATQSPMAHDLRLLAADLEVITELERIGDYAKGIAKVAMQVANDEIPIPIREITMMADMAVSMLHRALGAFIAEDVSVARSLPEEDDQVDELYNLVYRKIVQNMIANPEVIDLSNQVFWVIHNLERTADRVTNICERILFIATGELVEMDSTDDELEEGWGLVDSSQHTHKRDFLSFQLQIYSYESQFYGDSFIITSEWYFKEKNLFLCSSFAYVNALSISEALVLKENTTKGKLIVVEGIDGSGK